ncbi:MAG TPA: malto-oligosyltrehalose trehalohydrolase [Puia sp.]|nr:malto-oligosyltrehalose trehalohydrolase [Puia sp.]
MNQSLIPVGAAYSPEFTEFSVWAPFRRTVELLAGPSHVLALQKDEQGYWRGRAAVDAGCKYLYRLDGQIRCPDPASLSQPEGVHGRSAVVDIAGFRWRDDGWGGIPLANLILYELHVGTFTHTHDFDGVARKLDYLAELGVNAIELMPLAQFPGSRNWGYDGVYPFAVQHSYGGVTGFRQLVNSAHERGIAIVVDVVYNHFGPEGNYLTHYGPYFTDNYRTPWGSAVNFDDAWSDGVRNYFLQNARMWLEDYHVDALRLDAVHAIKDLSAIPFVRQLKELAMEIEHRTGRRKLLIAELDLNDPRYIHPPSRGGYGLDGQWVDEFHHALRALLTGDRSAYYEDFGEIGHLERAFRNTYVYNGVYSAYRKRVYGGHADACPYDQFVVFSQNHDQVGNRACGERLTAHLTKAQLKLAAAAVLLSPYVPLLFMGEEYGERNPFPFFVDFEDPALIKAVREGRIAEFKGFLSEGRTIPDPEAAETFDRAVLSWEGDAVLLNYYKALIRLRKTRPALQGRMRDTMIVHPAAGSVLILERKIPGDHVYIFFNFGDSPVQAAELTSQELRTIFSSEAVPAGNIAPWSVVVCELIHNLTQ